MIEKIYIIDTSSLIELKSFMKYSEIVPGFQDATEELIKTEQLISIEFVYEELKRYLDPHDPVYQWAHRNRKMFKQLKSEHQVTIKKILDTFPKAIDQNKEFDPADPYLVAMAVYQEPQRTLKIPERIVVAEERRTEKASTKIPNMCDHFKIRCISVGEMMQELKFEFK